MRVAFILLLVASALFVWLTSASLPPVVASHFGASGAANGFMSRSVYLGFMLAVVVLVPTLVALSGQLARLLPASFVNLPNRTYWLAPERRDSTATELAKLSLFPACLILVFLCFVHWWVVQANLSRSRQLAAVPFWLGLALFAIAICAWLVVLHRRFGRVP
jgi:serine/threonine-protein kinase